MCSSDLSGCKRYARFRIAHSTVFLRGGNSGPRSGNSGPGSGNSGPRKFRPWHRNIRTIFSSEHFWLSLFGFSLWRGSGISGLWSGIFGPRKIWLSLFRVFSLVGVRNFAPEVCSGNFRGTGNSGVSPGISGSRPEVPAPLTRNFRPCGCPTASFWGRL